jgi:protein involved in polysaccharide export with SLBB domain
VATYGAQLATMAHAQQRPGSFTPPGLVIPSVSTAESRQPAGPFEQPVDPTTYIVGPGDAFVIYLWGAQSFTYEVAVGPEGGLFIPRAGSLRAAGATLAELRAEVESTLRASYTGLRMAFELVRPRTFLLSVSGAVGAPGTYPATALTRVSQLIAKAGGVARDGSLRSIELRGGVPRRTPTQGTGAAATGLPRARGTAAAVVAPAVPPTNGPQLPTPVQRVDMVRVQWLGDTASGADPFVLEGQAIFVPPRGAVASVHGAVARPGEFELVQSTTAAELVALAGGTTSERATALPWRLERAVRTTSAAGSLPGLIEELRPLAPGEPGPVVAPGDRLYVPPRTEEQAGVRVRGAVAGDGRYGIDSAVARGSTDRRLDVSTSASAETMITLPWVSGLTAGVATQRAGGLLPWANASGAYIDRSVGGASASGGEARRQHIPVDLRRVVELRDRSGDVVLLPGDELIIPSVRGDVMVSGAVAKPGLYRYDPAYRALDYIRIAGGVLRSSNVDNAVVVRGGGRPQQSIKTIDHIAPGDVLVVPEASLIAPEWIQLLLVFSNIAAVTTGIYFQLR